MTLDSMPKGVSGRVLEVDERSTQSFRLMEMGLVPGAPIRLVKSAPLGDPIQVCIRGYQLALRRSEARGVMVELSIDD